MLRKWWLPGVLILTVLLVSSALLGAWLSDIARSEAAEAADLPLDRVEADGLDIELLGFEDPAELEEAVAAADALDSTWSVVGRMAEGAEVDGAADEQITDVAADEPDATDDEVTAADEQADGAGAGDDAEDAADEPVDVAAAALSATITADGVTIEGVVADDGGLSAALAVLGEEFGVDAVADDVTVDPRVVADGGTLTVVGEAPSDDRATAWRTAMAAVAAATGGLTLEDRITVSAVAAELNALFALEPIEFGERSDTLDEASRSTLDEAAAVLLATDDRLRVVGHTDSDGGANGNQSLSERRAASVVAYLVEAGVAAERLEAVGRGEAQLLIDPERTAEDKQRNRRIEWEPLP
ncbi:MAG: OmpA family protein [Actinomycetota bacterium]